METAPRDPDFRLYADYETYSNIPTLSNDGLIARNKEFTDLIHSYGSEIFCQIYHAGKQKMPNVPGQAIAPSAIKDPLAINMPRKITKEEIHQIVKDFGDTARRAKKQNLTVLKSIAHMDISLHSSCLISSIRERMNTADALTVAVVSLMKSMRKSERISEMISR